MLLYKIIDLISGFIKEKKEYLAMPFICLAVVMPMFFRGLYFEADRAIFGIIASIVLAAVFIIKKKTAGLNLHIDAGCILLTAIYGITAAFAVNKDSAILAFASYILLLIIYVAVKGDSDREDKIYGLVTVICYAIALTSLISLLTAAGIINYPGSYSDAEAEKWLNGTVQYHNAFGILALAGFFGLCGVYAKSMKKPLYWVNLLGYYLLMFGIIMSYSRGAWLIAPFVFIIYLIMADKDARLKMISYLVTSAIAVFAVLSPFTQAVDSASKTMGGVWLVIGFVIAVILGVMLDVVVNQIKNHKYFNRSVVAAGVVVIALVLVIVLFPSAFSFMLPQSLVTRLEGLNFGTQTVTERFVFYGDALRMSVKNIFFGLGGGAWSDMYGMYQSYDYSSSQIHSYPMQILTDTGIIGVIAFIWIAVFLIIGAIKLKKNKAVSGGLLASLFSVCGALLLHSLIDFDLSIFGVTAVLWAVLAAISALAGKSDFKASKYVWVALCAVMIVFSVTDYLGTSAEARADEIFNKFYGDELEGFDIKPEKYTAAFEEYGKAVKFKPYDAVALSAKAKTRMFAHNENKEHRELAVLEFEKAEKMAPYSFAVQGNGIEMYSRSGGTLRYAVTCLKNQVNLFPKNLNNYLVYIKNAYEVMNYYRYDGIMNVAGEIAKEAMTLKPLAEENNVELPDATKGYFDMFEVVYNNTLRGTDKE
ncbi:MAG: O-antigen ligase family protein [Clostridia bacterium]|nr:O-antigen ligase family protein [Clostridia bacterium]